MASTRPESAGPLRPLVQPLEEFAGEEAASGFVLAIVAVVAMTWANAASGSYADVWTHSAHIDAGSLALHLSVRDWINDALMTLFFFVVSLEIKRELLAGELADRRRAMLPLAAAFGGMLVPAVIYASVNVGASTFRGWGIPMATDIAIAVAVLSLLRRRVPASLRGFLLALAIVDDIGGIAVIAIFYAQGMSLLWLAIAAAVFLVAAILSVMGLRHVAIFAAIGLAGWLAVHESGVHPTIAGVALACVLPVRYGDSAEHASIVDSAERLVHPWTSYVIVPLFALANVGVDLSAHAMRDALTSPVSIGVALGLLVGKPAGILLFSLASVRLRLAALPEGVTWAQLAGAAMIAGVGLTVALFIGGLAFSDPSLVDEAKVGVLFGSIASGLAGAGWLYFASTRSSAKDPSREP